MQTITYHKLKIVHNKISHNLTLNRYSQLILKKTMFSIIEVTVKQRKRRTQDMSLYIFINRYCVTVVSCSKDNSLHYESCVQLHETKLLRKLFYKIK